MARWLIAQAALHDYILPANHTTSSFIAIAAGLVLSMSCVTLILSMCSFCDKRKQVGDKASSSDGDASASPAAAAGKQALFLIAKKPMSAQRVNNNMGIEEKEAAAGGTDQQLQQQLQQGKLSPHVWQRTILMGERCQRPTFSGLVLYDEKGNPLPLRRFG